MKHDWEWRSFEACLEKVIYTKKLQSSDYLSEGKYPIVSQEEGLISGYWDNDDDIFKITKPIVIFGDHTRVLKYIDFNFVLGADGVKILQPIDDIKAKFLYYYLRWFNVPSLGYSRHYKLLKECSVPIPPLPIQEQIVAELDNVSEIIEKKKQQVKELNNLAQSIFYDMFGDPVENEKGWEVCRLEDYCEVSSSKRVLVEDVVESGIPFLRGTELTILNKVSSSKDVQFTMFITPEHYERVKAITGVPKKGDILIPSINSEGISWVVDTDEPFYFKDGRVIWVHVNHDVFSSKYLKYAISQVLKANYSVLTSGATFLELKLFIVRDLNIPIPPLPLQHSFAQKIEAIERQKELITASIKEAQLLFDARMDYWFGE